LIRGRFVATLLRKELLRFLANPALGVLLLLFFLVGALVGGSDVILRGDHYNLVLEQGDPSDFLRFAASREAALEVFGPADARSARGLDRRVLVRQGGGGPDRQPGTAGLPPLEISSPELSPEDLGRLRDLLVKNAFLYLGVRAPLDIRIVPPSSGPSLQGPEVAADSARSPEDFKKLIMALLITISLNVVNFNLLTVSFTEEKQNRTLLALLLSPARGAEVASAKALFFLLPGLALPASMAAFYRPHVLAEPVFWATLAAGALLYQSMALLLASFVERQSTANLVCLGYLFLLSSLFILAPRFPALAPVKNLLPENFLFSILSFLFDGTPLRLYARFFWSFLAVAAAAPFLAMAVFTRRLGARPPETGPRGRRWTLGDCAAIFGLCLFFHFVVSPAILGLLGAAGMGPRQRMTGIALLYLAVFALPLALILPVYARVKFRQGLLPTFFGTASPGRDLLVAAAWFAAYLGGVLAAAWVAVFACMPQVPPEALGELKALAPPQLLFFRQAARLVRGLGPGSVLAFLLVLGVAVPVLEECFFRGCLLSALQSRWGPRTALVGSALCFGAAHLNPLLFPLYFLLGLLTGRLAQKRKGLLAPAAFHALNNLASLGAIFVVL